VAPAMMAHGFARSHESAFTLHSQLIFA